MHDSTIIRRLAVAALTTTIAGVFGSLAVAANPPPVSGASAVSQYVEVMPSAGGPIVSGTRQKRTISPALQKKIASVGKKDAAALRSIVQSAGPPAAPRKSRPAGTSKPALKIAQPVSSPRSTRMTSSSVFAAPLNVELDHSTRLRVLGLAMVLLVTALAVVGLGLRRRNVARRHDTQTASS